MTVKRAVSGGGPILAWVTTSWMVGCAWCVYLQNMTIEEAYGATARAPWSVAYGAVASPRIFRVCGDSCCVIAAKIANQ